MSQKPLNTLTIEYAGIIALVWDKDSKGKERGRAILVDVGKTQAIDSQTGQAVYRTSHFPSLTLPSTKEVTGSVPDLVTTLPTVDSGRDGERMTWRLKGTTVSIQSDRKDLAVFTPEYDATVPLDFPTANTIGEKRNLYYMADLAKMTGAKALRTDAPISATVVDLRGAITARATEVTRAFSFTFQDNGQAVAPADRFVATRFRQVLTFENYIEIQLKKKKKNGVTSMRTILVKRNPDPQITNLDMVISNLCPCDSEEDEKHFNSYYDLLENPGCSPEITSADQTGTNPAVDPEHCIDCLIRLL